MILGVSIFFFHIAAQTSGPFVKVEVLDFCPLLLFGSSICFFVVKLSSFVDLRPGFAV